MRTKFTSSFLLILCVLSACGGEASDSEPATTEDCRKVQEHLASLRVQSGAQNSNLDQNELAKHRANFAVTNDARLEVCKDKRSKGWARCMLALKTAGDAPNCED